MITKISHYLADKVESLSAPALMIFLTLYQLAVLMIFKLPFFNHLSSF